eukprot:153358-Hanusia_phi.AAC.1
MKSQNEDLDDMYLEFPTQTEPPYLGESSWRCTRSFGTEEDSIASFYRLIPKTRKVTDNKHQLALTRLAQYDPLKQEELDKIVFR